MVGRVVHHQYGPRNMGILFFTFLHLQKYTINFIYEWMNGLCSISYIFIICSIYSITYILFITLKWVVWSLHSRKFKGKEKASYIDLRPCSNNIFDLIRFGTALHSWLIWILGITQNQRLCHMDPQYFTKPSIW